MINMGFTKLKVHEKLVQGLKLMGITDPTAIQQKAIPEIKAGKDVVGQSLTGSGKTAAFGLPILEKVVPGEGIQALVLTPTRELCLQVKESLETMSRFLPINIITIYGGVGFYEQTEGIKIAEVVVATPGRLLDHMGRGNIKLNKIKYVVLDEADKMFEMGFEEDVSRILSQTPHTRQTTLFSATMPKAAQHIVKKYLKNPIYVQEKLHVDKTLLKQAFYTVHRDQKFPLLAHLLKEGKITTAIVFCGTKRAVDKIARDLHRQKIKAMPVHGDLAQTKRQLAVKLFKEGRIDVLVATDVAARGLDIKDVTHIYNYDVPKTPEDYTHRIGRTARAGKKGEAITFVNERDYENFDRILRAKKFDIVQEKVPQIDMSVGQTEYRHEPRAEEGGQGYGGRRDSFRQERNFEPRNSYPRRNNNQRNSHGNYSRNNDRQGGYASQGNYSHRPQHSFGGRGGYERRSEGNYPQHRQRKQYNYNGEDNYSGSYGERRHSSVQTSFHSAKQQNQRHAHSNYHADRAGTSFGQREHRGYSHKQNFSHGAQRQESAQPKRDFEQQTQGANSSSELTLNKPDYGGYERTPRTTQPLFPESHYNPEYKKHVKPKQNKRDDFGEREYSHENKNMDKKPHFFKQKSKKKFGRKKY